MPRVAQNAAFRRENSCVGVVRDRANGADQSTADPFCLHPTERIVTEAMFEFHKLHRAVLCLSFSRAATHQRIIGLFDQSRRPSLGDSPGLALAHLRARLKPGRVLFNYPTLLFILFRLTSLFHSIFQLN